jgi:hypothetical protein
MSDSELIRAYAISVFIATFLDEYGKLERLGAFARVYNTIIKKNGVFQDQINDLVCGRRKKISHKAELFSRAIKISETAWDMGVERSRGLSISAGVSIANLYRLNEDVLSRIYGLKMSDFVEINKLSQAGVTFNSCKMARGLTESVTTIISTSGAKHE